LSPAAFFDVEQNWSRKTERSARMRIDFFTVLVLMIRIQYSVNRFIKHWAAK